jgi:hypothetical protein
VSSFGDPIAMTEANHIQLLRIVPEEKDTLQSGDAM